MTNEKKSCASSSQETLLTTKLHKDNSLKSPNKNLESTSQQCSTASAINLELESLVDGMDISK